ncbi:cation:proton antiporter [Azospirillum sp. TSO35-2]|uniref:cation:proton antiporter domain-containing protein n=1 Tax=Azospirillum sp. TSO35-2 TaxID=716796 RepID=UPI0018EEAAAC|nr:cation:proton antiporter [Azospirillum sp. TSO35-2]
MAILLAALLPASVALAAAPGAGGASPAPSETILIAQIVVLILTGRLLGEVMQRIGQPAVMGPLIAGILLGPTALGSLWPGAQHALFPSAPAQTGMLNAVSQIGVLLLLLLAGMETDLSLIRRVRRAAFSVSLTGIFVPFACGFALGQFIPDAMLPNPDQRLIASLFLGTALSISSVKIVAMVVREMNFVRRNVGQVILASAIIDDTIGWMIIAITFGLAAQATFEWTSLAESVLGTVAFIALSLTVGRRLVARVIRWTNDSLVSEAPVLSAVLVIMGLMALATDAIGVHTVLGAFVAGILVGSSPILTRRIDDQFRGVTTALFMPVFFGVAGLKADLTILADPMLLGLTAGLVLIASIGKFTGAFIGGWMGGLDRREALALATGMNARGSTEVIVASIGLSMGVLTQELFTMIVTMAILTTLAMPPTLRWALRRLPMGREESERLEREAFEAKGFVPNVERVLLAVDETPPGRLAARLAGMLAGLRGVPVTVVGLTETAPAADATEADARQTDSPDTGHEAVILASVEATQERTTKPDEPSPEVEVLTRPSDMPAEDIIESEATKGYDLLMVGTEEETRPVADLPARLSELANRFDGPLAVVSARGTHQDRPVDGRLDILVAVSGTEVSRRAAEVALALGRAGDAPVTVLYVGLTAVRASRRNHRQARRDAEAALDEISGIAERYGRSVRTIARTDLSAEDAVMEQARRGGHTLVVMGVSRQGNEVLSFGAVAGALLEHADRSLLFVAT